MEPTQTPPNTPAVSRKVIILAITAGAIILLVIAGLVVAQLSKRNPSTPTVTVVPTPTPVDKAKAPSLIVFQNFDILFDEGLTNDQVDGLKFAINKYAKVNQKGAETVYINAATIRTVLHDTKAGRPRDTSTFNIGFSNKATLGVKVEYFDFTAVQVYITDTNSAVIFNSGVVDVYNGIGTN